jgi:hypothetical protein
MSWHLEGVPTPDPAAVVRWQALVWLLQRAEKAVTNVTGFAEAKTDPTPGNFQRARELSDALARAAADRDWSLELDDRLLRELASSTNDFSDVNLPPLLHACRAERLVLGLDRLFVGMGKEPAAASAESQLQILFKGVQSLPDFDTGFFRKHLAGFAGALPPRPLN